MFNHWLQLLGIFQSFLSVKSHCLYTKHVNLTREIASSRKTCSALRSYTAMLLLQCPPHSIHSPFLSPCIQYTLHMAQRSTQTHPRFAKVFSNIHLRNQLTKLPITVPSEREDFMQLEELTAPQVHLLTSF